MKRLCIFLIFVLWCGQTILFAQTNRRPVHMTIETVHNLNLVIDSLPETIRKPIMDVLAPLFENRDSLSERQVEQFRNVLVEFYENQNKLSDQQMEQFRNDLITTLSKQSESQAEQIIIALTSFFQEHFSKSNPNESSKFNPKRWNYLPFGVHQFATEQTGKGILFAGTQIGLPILGGFLASKTRDTYNNTSK